MSVCCLKFNINYHRGFFVLSAQFGAVQKYGWEFLFIGANIDAVETAASYGIDKDRAVNYNADGEGTHILYDSVAKAVCNVRASAPLSADWAEEINADYQRRGKKN